MKKKIIAFILVISLLMSFAGCGLGIWTCAKCDTTIMKAYYDMSANSERIMCEDCAGKYWMPLSIEIYRVR